MKNSLKTLITIALSTLLLQACWTKKCENPDAEHRSWTMIPEGRTADYIFKSKFGESIICKSYPPKFSKSTGTGSTLDECNGEIYSCQLGIHYLLPPNYQSGGTEDLHWTTIKYTTGTHETNVFGDHTNSGTITYKQDTMQVNLISYATKIRLSYVEIIKNKGIYKFILNDTIYAKIN